MFFIILCTYRPDLEYLRAQIDSIRAQTIPDFQCLVQDDASSPEWSEKIRQLCELDARFSFRRNPERLDVFHNFERGLYQTPKSAQYVCYSDQDDLWAPEKLERQRAAFADPEVMLCHTDLELIDEQDRKLHASCFQFERRNITDYSLPQLIMRNSVTGCTLAFRAELLPHLLPFPHQGLRPRFHHDHFTALIATEYGRILPICEPLVRYRQHGANVLGAANVSYAHPIQGLLKHILRAPAAHLRGLESEWNIRREWIELLLRRAPATPREGARLNVIHDWMQGKLGSARLLEFTAAHLGPEDSLAPIGPGVFVGKMHQGIMRARAQLSRRPFESRSPGARPESGAAPLPIDATMLPLPLTVSAEIAPAMNLVLGSLADFPFDPELRTALALAVALQRRGQTVRCLVTEQPLGPELLKRVGLQLQEEFGSYSAKVDDLEKYEATVHLDFIDVSPGSESARVGIEVSPQDRFVATSWRTALRVRKTLHRESFFHAFLQTRFAYLIQDFEPGAYPFSYEYALASSSYTGSDYLPIYSTHELARYFERHVQDAASLGLVFSPRIDWARFAPPTIEDLAARTRCRVFIMGGPNLSRSLFPLVLRGLRRWLDRRKLVEDRTPIDIVAAGDDFAPIGMEPGVTIASLGRLSPDRYAAELRRSDLGIALRLSPHPAHAAFEMAAAAVPTVTNLASDGEAARLGEKSPRPDDNLFRCVPTEDSFVEALDQAYAVSKTPDRRLLFAARVRDSQRGLSIDQLIDNLLRELDGQKS